MDSTSVFHEHASWMLQTALGADGKANNQYEYCDTLEDTADVLKECKERWGLSEQDIALVRIRRDDLSGIRAAGVSGKRSIMLAVVIAVLLHCDDMVDDLITSLKEYELDSAFCTLLQSARESVPETHNEKDGHGVGNHFETDGVEVDIICGNVPVVSLDNTSIFSENVSWLLQTALDCYGKADSCFAYDDDKKVLAECQETLGLSEHEAGIVRLRRDDLKHIKAVGTNGKRSIMLAAVVAYGIHSEDGLASFESQIQPFSPCLWQAFLRLIENARQAAGRQRRKEDGRRRHGRERHEGAEPSDTCGTNALEQRLSNKRPSEADGRRSMSGGKRRRGCCYAWPDDPEWMPEARASSSKRGSGKAAAPADAGELDKMLDAYWNE